MLKRLKTMVGRYSPVTASILKLLTLVPLTINFHKLATNYAYDFKRFTKWSSLNKQKYSQAQLRALITMDYHRIEKGLALKEPRVGFGLEVVQRLLSNLQEYEKTYELDETGQIALNVLFAYYNFNLGQGLNDEQLYQQLINLKETIVHSEQATNQGGTDIVSKHSILDAAKIDLRNFFKSRYSIRYFATEDIEISLIETAVAMAQKTPSVCNRQSSKVYVFSKVEDKQKVLSYQNGNRGFGDQASKVLIVTSSLEHFVSIGEHNQCWIDGGMFAMSLVYALHSLGVGTCCLNWSVEMEMDQKLRKAAEISDSEAIIMMLAVGHLPNELNVAQSPRKKLEEILIIK